MKDKSAKGDCSKEDFNVCFNRFSADGKHTGGECLIESKELPTFPHELVSEKAGSYRCVSSRPALAPTVRPTVDAGVP